MLAELLVVARIAQGIDPAVAVLRPGETVEGVITDEDPPVHTVDLDANYLDVAGQDFLVRAGGAGPYAVELRSHYLDAYLVLRDLEGELLAEDDDGLLGTHARIVMEMRAGETRRVQAVAVHGMRGPFALSFTEGHPQALSPVERLDADIAEVQRGLEVVEEALGAEHPTTAGHLNILASFHLRRGDLATALSLHRRALAIRQKVFGDDHPDVATSLGGVGSTLFEMGDFEAARPFLERSLEIKERALGPDHPATALALGHLGGVVSKLGEYEAARSLWERALEVDEKTRGPEHPYTAMTLNNLASLLKGLGDYQAARPLLERSLAIKEKTLGPGHPSVATSLGHLGDVLEAVGDLEAALPLFERALLVLENAWGPEHRNTAVGLTNVGRLLRRMGDHEGARPLLERSVAIREKELGTEHIGTARSLIGLALVLVRQGEVESALPLLERGFAIRERALGPRHQDTARALRSLGMTLVLAGHLERALLPLERSLEFLEECLGPAHLSTAISRGTLALLLVDLDESESAWEVAIHDRGQRLTGRTRLMPFLAESERYRHAAASFWQLEALLSIQSSREDDEARLVAYHELLAWKGQVARTLVASRRRLAQDSSAEERALLAELQICQGRLAALLGEGGDRELEAERLVELRELRKSLELALIRTGEGSEDIASVAPSDVRAALPERSAALELLFHRSYLPARRDGEGDVVEPGRWSDRRLSAWIQRRDRDVPVRLELGTEAEVTAALRGHLRSFGGVTGAPERGVAPAPASAAEGSEDVRRFLWAPLAPHLIGIDTVFVSTDGVLGTLPFETLPLGDGRFAIEEHAFVYLQSLATLPELTRRRASRRLDSLLCVGGVDFDARGEALPDTPLDHPRVEAGFLRGKSARAWARLPGTAREAEAVLGRHAGVLGGAGKRLLLRGPDATEERLREEMQRHAVVHLATHGFFNPTGLPSLWASARAEGEADAWSMELAQEARALLGRHPGLLSGLICAGANLPEDGREDGFLTAEEVAWLDLSQVELVVLSACETGLGRAEAGEGLIGLRSAFEAAGAKTVVSSLWKVQDRSTAELMESFYENLWSGEMGKLEALRTAQLAMLARNRAEQGQALPLTWGAFVLSGDWR